MVSKLPLSRVILWVPLVLIMVVAVACGGAAAPTVAPDTPPTAVSQASPTAVPEGAPTAMPEVAPTAMPGAAPTAVPQPTEAPAMARKPEGTLNIGQSSLGTFIFHPSIAGNPAIYVVSTTMGEGLVSFNKDRQAVGMLAESWSISDDFLTWTFNVQEGVQLHKGYGELTADDIIYSYQQWASETSVHARASFMKDFWAHPDGSVSAPDSSTVVVNTGKPWVSIRALEFLRHVGGTSADVVSKKQAEELGIDAASRDAALTGPWALVETKTGEFWKMEAVEDHWRKTPNFAELVLWEIPEESARLAGFQTGNLDTFVMSFDNIPQVEKVQGAQLQSVGLISQSGLNLYGQLYVGIDDPDQKGDFDGERAWVSSNPDVNSPEWENARKVRRAMSIAIDRQTIVDTLLAGFGGPLCVRDWGGFEERMLADWTCDFDPEGAKQLLAEAGYPDGFSIELAAAIRGVPAEVEACEAIASMWENVGISVKIQRIPYQTLRPQLVGRTWPGATCHSISIRLEPMLGLNNYMSKSTFTYGTFHSYLDEKIPGVVGELNDAKRRDLTVELYDWMVNDQQLGLGLYTIEGVLPIGPKIQPWEYTSFSDIRLPNGYENILPR